MSAATLTPDALHEALAERLAQRPLLLLLDVDGTLAPIAPRPEDAVVPDATREALGRLVTTPHVHVVLVSGRGAADAHRMVGVEGVWAVGNHGIETLDPHGVMTVDAGVAPWVDVMLEAAADAAAVADAHPGVHVENKTYTLSVHWRQADPSSEAPLRDALGRLAAARGLRLTEGKRVFELRPPVRIHKGTASLAITERLVGTRGTVLYAGDDRTDEDAFVALRAVRPTTITIRVLPTAGTTSEAPTDSAAEFALDDVEAMGAWLRRLAGA